MEENKIGLFIRDRRLALGLTQQQLAERVGITDKAVSKWERSVSYPDITLLRELAAALEVSVTELWRGAGGSAHPGAPGGRERGGRYRSLRRDRPAKKQRLAVVALCGADRWVPDRGDGAADRWSGRGSLWAALLAIRCIAFGWAVCYPLLRSERPVRNALIIASIGVYPFLLSLGLWEMRGLCIVIVSVAYAWAVYWIWLRWRGDWRKLTFLVVVLGILLHVGINVMVRWGDGERLLLALVLTLVLGALCLAAAWALERRRR